MGNPIENALACYKKTYAWDKDLIEDTEEELSEIKKITPGLVAKKKEQILL